MATTSLAALKIAQTQIGQTEKPLGSNWGEPVKTYLASVNINFPASWCMAFVYWCIKQTGIKNDFVKSAGVLDVWNKTLKQNKSTTPLIGSVFIMDFGKGLGHTGIVESFDADYIYSIEGNTNDTGSREGIAVCKKKRLRTSIKGYIIIN
jgi:hypothetical protein